MAKNQKLIERLLSFPKDFTWDELLKILNHFGYKELKKGKTSGSRRKFVDDKKSILNLHKPHPGNVLKRYMMDDVVASLKEKGYIQDE